MKKTCQEINWEEQWALFAPQFQDGLSHIDLQAFGGDNGRVLKLAPGGGFGDLSHPTTRLMLRLMADRIKGQCVVDIGCGSGILTLAALLLGAKDAIGIDIDPLALCHAEKNTKINELGSRACFSMNLDSKRVFSPLLILINMISSEQIVAWDTQRELHSLPAHIIASGILKSQREEYLKLAATWGWTCNLVIEEEGWLGFVFQQ